MPLTTRFPWICFRERGLRRAEPFRIMRLWVMVCQGRCSLRDGPSGYSNEGGGEMIEEGVGEDGRPGKTA
jgi:hypothetical protein